MAPAQCLSRRYADHVRVYSFRKRATPDAGVIFTRVTSFDVTVLPSELSQLRNTSTVLLGYYLIRKARTSPVSNSSTSFFCPVSPFPCQRVVVSLDAFLPLRGAFPVGIFIIKIVIIVFRICAHFSGLQILNTCQANAASVIVSQ